LVKGEEETPSDEGFKLKKKSTHHFGRRGRERGGKRKLLWKTRGERDNESLVQSGQKKTWRGVLKV